MGYRCKECNKIINRRKRQWKSNYARLRSARICPDCFTLLYHKWRNAKDKLNAYKRIIYPQWSW